MQPGARLQAAIEILDAWLAGAAAEKRLTNWARSARYAGSTDRAHVRDIVFDCIRRRNSCAEAGGALTGRGLALGWLRQGGADPAAWFTGQGHAPATLSAAEQQAISRPLTDDPRVDLPPWLVAQLATDLGPALDATLECLRQRAPLFLRVATARGTIAEAQARLAEEGIDTSNHMLADTALKVDSNPRRVASSAAYREGRVEIQDVASQAVIQELPRAERVLDFCAGGGGKALALADRGAGAVFAHDAAWARMSDIETRAARAGVAIAKLRRSDLAGAGPFDLVLCDAPCSGSGAWRRSPEVKWRLTPQGLRALNDTQLDILKEAAPYVAPGGMLAYATCSLLRCENEELVSRFLSRCPEWQITRQRRLSPLEGGDGFFVALLTKKTPALR